MVGKESAAAAGMERYESERTDHAGVGCTVEGRAMVGPMLRRAPGKPRPLLRGMRNGVARRPGKGEGCAREDTRAAGAGENVCFYCRNDMERPRVPPSASGVVVEDPRRVGLFRLRLRRNDAQVNSMMALVSIA